MATQQSKVLYCFDTSALIDSWRRYYHPDIFKPMWDEIDSMIAEGTILIPNEVKKEIGTGDDDLVKWFKKHHGHVTHVTVEQIKIVGDIVNKYPLISHYKKVKPYHADPFVVAVAKEFKCKVVSYEGVNKSTDHPKIPDLCREYDIPHLSMPDFFREMSWKFNIK
jgi:hypothetical protein